MIAFATIFLGLVAGVHDVELLVGTEVAAVELRLDDTLIVRLEAPPWRAPVDLGSTIEPHRLEAIALDATGEELERVEQWLNLPGPAAEAEFALDLRAEGTGSRARLSWKSVLSDAPRSVDLSLDGQPIAVEEPSDFELPSYDPLELHLLRAELSFADNLMAVAEATFGGFFAESVSSELTAVPVAIDGAAPSIERLQSMVEVSGEPAPVVAMDQAPADVVVVRDSRSRRELLGLGRNRTPAAFLGADRNLRLLWPVPQPHPQGDELFLLFPRSAEVQLRRDSFYPYLARSQWAVGSETDQRLADAVAVAGLVASERNRPRAVILVLGSHGPENSQLQPVQVRHYLSTIGVPLYVWSTDARSWSRNDHGWGEVSDISTATKLGKAARRVRRDLDRQHVMWLAGTHLPQRVALRGSTERMSLVR